MPPETYIKRKEMKEIILKFIEDNSLDFSGTGSELNSNCVTLAGFVCFVNNDRLSFTTVRDNTLELLRREGVNLEAAIEFEKVLGYAWNNNYEKFWTTDEARELYTF